MKSKISENELTEQGEIPIIEENENNQIFRELLEKEKIQKRNNKKTRNNIFGDYNSDEELEFYEADQEDQ